MQMNKEYIEKFDVIRRYNQNKLSDEELNSFEVFILENPDMISLIEKEQAVYDAFRENESLLKDSTDGPMRMPWEKGLAVAAGLVVALLVVLDDAPSPQDFTLQPPVVLETFRGASDNRIQVNGTPVVRFQIDMGPPDFIENNSFTAELVGPGGSSSYQQSGLEVDRDGWLNYALEGQASPISGEYTVRVSPDAASGRISDYSVTFISPTSP